MRGVGYLRFEPANRYIEAVMCRTNPYAWRPLMKTDATTKQILGLLRKRARMSYKEIAQEIGKPESTVRDRVKKLEAAGIIRGYTAILDRNALGLGCSAFVVAACENGRVPEVTQALLALPNVLQVHHTSGAKRIVFLVAAKDFEDLLAFLGNGLSKLRLRDEEVIVILKSFREYAAPLDF
jgi:Lrp/AsnC family leucine-responsive transcriptional regulator